jgi:hypothetical protein
LSFSLFSKSRCSPCHPVMIQWSECSTVFSLFSKSHCSPCQKRKFSCITCCFCNLDFSRNWSLTWDLKSTKF